MKRAFSNQDIIILGVAIDDVSLPETMSRIGRFLVDQSRTHLIFTPNPEICLKAAEDSEYRKTLNESDLNIPDGVGLKLGAEILGMDVANRVTGVDLTMELLRQLHVRGGQSIYIISKEDSLSSLDDIKKQMTLLFPSIEVYGQILAKDNLNNILTQVAQIHPTVVFATIGAPEQEKLLVDLVKQGMVVPLAMAVGGTFDFITGKQKRAPNWWRDLGIEWFYRLLQQPQRLGRIGDATIKFPMAVYNWKKRMETTYRPNVMAIITRNGEYLIQRNKRFDREHWQFAQGGIEVDEDAGAAAIREASEELGIDQSLLNIEKQLPVTHQYNFPRWSSLLYGYKGQEQLFYLLNFTGSDKDIHLHESEEVSQVKWVPKEALLTSINPIRHESLKKFLPYLG